MRSLLAAAFFATFFGDAGCSQSSLLARTSSQQLGVDSAFLQEQGSAVITAEVGAGGSTSIPGSGAPTCDTILSDPICFAGKRQALLPNAVPNGLVAHWDFNSESALDTSGNGNHGVTELVHGPSPVGGGHSGVFSKNFMMVPNSELLKTSDFTYSFWIYLLDDGMSAASKAHSATWCPIIRKGIHEAETEQFASAPALLFNRHTGKMRAEITTSVQNLEDGEHVDSNARLLSNRWMHIGVVHHGSRRSLLLYVNGILDAALTTSGTMVPNDYPLYVGGDPFTMDQCEFTVYIDEVRVFSHAVPPHQLGAEAAPALGGTDPSYVRLGCAMCTLEEAAARCPKNRHICTSTELHTGGYQVARSLGWLVAGSHVWTHMAVVKGATAKMGGQTPTDTAESSFGLGLCCEGTL